MTTQCARQTKNANKEVCVAQLKNNLVHSKQIFVRHGDSEIKMLLPLTYLELHTVAMNILAQPGQHQLCNLLHQLEQQSFSQYYIKTDFIYQNT